MSYERCVFRDCARLTIWKLLAIWFLILIVNRIFLKLAIWEPLRTPWLLHLLSIMQCSTAKYMDPFRFIQYTDNTRCRKTPCHVCMHAWLASTASIDLHGPSSVCLLQLDDLQHPRVPASSAQTWIRGNFLALRTHALDLVMRRWMYTSQCTSNGA